MDKSIIERKVVDIIKKNSSEELSINNILERSFSDGIVNSLEFVGIVVDLEAEFNIEFDDDMLLTSSYENIGQLADYIFTKIKN